MNAIIAPPRQAVGRPTSSARLVNFKPALRSSTTLFGYATIAFGSLVINDIPIFRSPDGDLSPGIPGCVELGADGRAREQDGRKKYRPSFGFLTQEGRSRYERDVLGALADGGIAAQ